MRLKILTLALLPALAVQGYRVKKNIPKLSEPEGIRKGYLSNDLNPLSILIVGDSAAAGVGVIHQSQALSGCLIDELKNDYAITWMLQAKTGHSTDDVIHSVECLDNQHFDVVLTSVGVNDVTRLMNAQKWIEKQDHLYQLIRRKFTPQLIIATSVPPMHMFPALPNPLGWLFGQYAKAMNQKLAIYVKQANDMQWLQYDIEKYRELNLEMAEDGFHPSEGVYQLWAKQVADTIRRFISS